MMKSSESPSAERRRKFSRICGVKTTIQQAIEMEPHIPESASMSSFGACDGGYMVGGKSPECQLVSLMGILSIGVS